MKRTSACTQCRNIYASLFTIVALTLVRVGRAEDKCAQLFSHSETNSADIKPIPLSKADADRISGERVCIQSFPWPATVRTMMDADPSRLPDLTPTQMEAIRKRTFELIDKYKTRPSSPRLRRTTSLDADEKYVALHLATGADAEQMRLYADFLYARILVQHQNWTDVIKCSQEAKVRSGLAVTVHAIDEMEQHTYFSKQTLINMLASLELQSRAAAAPKALADRLGVLADYVDNAAALDPHKQIAGDPIEQLSSVLEISDLAPLQLEGPAWKRMEALKQFPVVHGSLKDKHGTVLFVGNNSIGAIELAAGEQIRFLSAEEAKGRFKTFCEKEIKGRSTPAMRLFGIFRRDDGADVVTADGKHIALTRSDCDSLKSGKALPLEHAFSQFVIGNGTKVAYSDPLMIKEGESLRESDAMTFNIQRSYPSARIMRDPLSDQTDGKVKKVASFAIASAAKIEVIVPDSKTDLPQGKTILNIVPELRAAHVKVTVFTGKEKPTAPQKKGIFLITGHSSDELASFVRNVGNAGFFKNNFVVLNTCETEVTRQLAAEINERYGAVGAFSFQGKIQASAVQDYLLNLVGRLDGKRQINFVDYLNETALKQNLTGTFTVCQNVLP